MKQLLEKLDLQLEGTLTIDDLTKRLYATDASVYREIPLAVAFPKSTSDLQRLIEFGNTHKIGLIPRSAGTSLAGQCVGDGIVVDISKHFTNILQFNQAGQTITLQPGVIRDDLNRFLEPHSLFFGPNTSTSNRCMIGGMVGNNSSGTTSIQYGVTRDKILALKVLLCDGSEVVFGKISAEEFQQKTQLKGLEGRIYRKLQTMLAVEEHQKNILGNFPKSSIHRRNTGYALDSLVQTEIFSTSTEKFNLAKLLAGSEGTLAFTTEITLKLDSLPPKKGVLVAAHFKSITDCLEAVVPVMKYGLFTCEMMDKTILDCTKSSLKYRENRFFIEDDPKAILLLEIRANDEENLQVQLAELQECLKQKTQSYASPELRGNEIDQSIELRKAGLGLLGNMEGDSKAVACIEDTAVAIEDLADYIAEFTAVMKQFDQQVVYYAHAGAGELHLRPILNLKKGEDVQLFKEITDAVSTLVKKYKGSFSGEHGDGRLRAAFIEKMVGAEVYALFLQVKNIFDPNDLFNPGKIVKAPPMNTSLRYETNRQEPKIETLLNFSDSKGFLRAVEKCNGSGDCRKSVEAGGTMCPSYRATKNEKDSTRGRANALREFLTQSEKNNRFDHEELKEVLDLCISCKGCKNECPSNVDMATYKAEFEYQYQQIHGSSLRTKLFAYNHKANQWGAKLPALTNFFFSNKLSAGLIKSSLGIAKKRSLPLISSKSLRKQIASGKISLIPKKRIKTLYLFIDEFTEHLDTSIGVDAINLLVHLGYEVKTVPHAESGRSYLSKGFLEEAKKLANENISIFQVLIDDETPLIGLEPSAILSFRDEYLRLANDQKAAEELSRNVFLIEEFLAEEMKNGNIQKSQFTTEPQQVKIHGHCHQKALSNIKYTFDILNFPKQYKVTVIPSGCCGMAGSFGYEKEHYDISMKIGEQTLFPALRKTKETVLIAANGTSCRHQIKDGVERAAEHPITILWQAVIKS